MSVAGVGVSGLRLGGGQYQLKNLATEAV